MNELDTSCDIGMLTVDLGPCMGPLYKHKKDKNLYRCERHIRLVDAHRQARSGTFFSSWYQGLSPEGVMRALSEGQIHDIWEMVPRLQNSVAWAQIIGEGLSIRFRNADALEIASWINGIEVTVEVKRYEIEKFIGVVRVAAVAMNELERHDKRD